MPRARPLTTATPAVGQVGARAGGRRRSRSGCSRGCRRSATRRPAEHVEIAGGEQDRRRLGVVGERRRVGRPTTGSARRRRPPGAPPTGRPSRASPPARASAARSAAPSARGPGPAPAASGGRGAPAADPAPGLRRRARGQQGPEAGRAHLVERGQRRDPGLVGQRSAARSGSRRRVRIVGGHQPPAAGRGTAARPAGAAPGSPTAGRAAGPGRRRSCRVRATHADPAQAPGAELPARSDPLEEGRPPRPSAGASSSSAAPASSGVGLDAPRPGPRRARRPPARRPRRSPRRRAPRSSSSAIGRHDLDPQVEPVEQRARQPPAVAGQRRRRCTGRRPGAGPRRTGTGSWPPRAGTGPGSSTRGVGPGDPHDALLERRAQRVEDVGGELAHLVQEEHAAVRQRDLAGPQVRRRRRRSAPPTRRRGGAPGTAAGAPARRAAGPRRPPSGPGSPRAPARGRAAGSSPDRRRASIVLPAPGGPTMSRWWPPAAATSSAWRASGLAPHVGQVDRGWRIGRRGRRLDRSGQGSSPRSTATSWPSRRPRCGPRWRPDEPGLDQRARRHHHRRARRRRRPAGRPPTTGRSAPSRPSSPRKAIDRTARSSSCSSATSTPTAMARSRRGAALAHARGRQVDGDAAAGPGQPARQQGGPHPVTRLAAHGVGRADDGEAGQPAGHVDLDDDGMAVDAEEGGRRDGGEHGGPPRSREREPRTRPLAGHRRQAARRGRERRTGPIEPVWTTITGPCDSQGRGRATILGSWA